MITAIVTELTAPSGQDSPMLTNIRRVCNPEWDYPFQVLEPKEREPQISVLQHCTWRN